MFAHVTIRDRDRVVSERYYQTVLGATGIGLTHDHAEPVAWDDVAIMAADPQHVRTRNLHVAFVTPSCGQVEAFWRAGVEAGYVAGGEPGDRPKYAPDCHGAFLLDPVRNSAEAAHDRDTRRGGHSDHPRIRVRSLAASESFYRTIARHTGLRDGRRCDTMPTTFAFRIQTTSPLAYLTGRSPSVGAGEGRGSRTRHVGAVF